MALFGKTDKDGVPLLTAFYQICVDAENPVGGELDILMGRRLDGPHSDTPLSAYASFRMSDAAREVLGLPKSEPDTTEKQLRYVAQHHALIVRFMNAYVENEGFTATPKKPRDEAAYAKTRKIVDEFDKLMEDVLSAPQFSYDLQNARLGVTYWPRLMPRQWDKPEAHRNTTSEYDGPLFLSSVLTALLNAVQNNTLTRCEECKSCFDASRAGQRYCSKRCANRVSNRRREGRIKKTD